MSDLWEKVSSNVKYLKPSTMQIGDEMIGIFLGSKIDETYGNLQHSFNSNGFTVIMNGTGQLNKAMEKVTQGHLVKIVYKGLSKMEKGKFKNKEAHQFEVFSKAPPPGVPIIHTESAIHHQTAPRAVVTNVQTAPLAATDFVAVEDDFIAAAHKSTADEKARRIEEARQGFKK